MALVCRACGARLVMRWDGRTLHFPVASVKPYEDSGATVSIKGRSVLSSVTFFGTTSCIHSDSYKTFPQSYMGHKETTPPNLLVN